MKRTWRGRGGVISRPKSHFCGLTRHRGQDIFSTFIVVVFCRSRMCRTGMDQERVGGVCGCGVGVGGWSVLSMINEIGRYIILSLPNI